ncbi:hypothetical protein [Pseudophaeobacter sp.]|uniref:hypothetical protein n=1 Tax=Pseudophaeobacter sp. TaxID=1971739 RepID=UPI003297274F
MSEGTMSRMPVVGMRMLWAMGRVGTLQIQNTFCLNLNRTDRIEDRRQRRPNRGIFEKQPDPNDKKDKQPHADSEQPLGTATRWVVKYLGHPVS